MVLLLLSDPEFFRNISFASVPVANIFPLFLSIATTEGSFNIIPLPFNVTKIFAVHKSIPISLEPNVNNFIILLSFLFVFIVAFVKKC